MLRRRAVHVRRSPAPMFTTDGPAILVGMRDKTSARDSYITDPAVESAPTRRRQAAPIFVAVLLLGALIIRLALLPLTAGNDFRAFDILAALSLHGRDVYALRLSHHLGTLPWTYFPLLLHIFAALQWVAMHTGWPFRILGKLPIVAADLAVGLLIYTALRRRGRGEGAALCGMALYLYNPFVLYNGAFYGRFDAIALAFLLLALESYRTRLFALAYALAIAAKTFPLFLLPLLALGRDRQRPRRLILACALVPLLALPELVTDPRGLLAIFDYVRPNFGRLSWYYFPLETHLLSEAHVFQLAHTVMWLYPVSLLLLLRGSLYVKAAGCFVLYLIFNQVVYEQYLLWPLPFLIVVGLHECDRLALWLAALMTVAGILENEYTWQSGPLSYHLAPTPWWPLNVAVAVSCVAFVINSLRLTGHGLMSHGRSTATDVA